MCVTLYNNMELHHHIPFPTTGRMSVRNTTKQQYTMVDDLTNKGLTTDCSYRAIYVQSSSREQRRTCVRVGLTLNTFPGIRFFINVSLLKNKIVFNAAYKVIP